jgi:replication factor C subunit 1
MNAENVKFDSQTKSAFTRIYNQQSHPLPFMKANNSSKKLSKDKPDLEEAIDESDNSEELAANIGDEDEEELDLKDKYVKAPKGNRRHQPKQDRVKDASEDDENEAVERKTSNQRRARHWKK